MQLLPSTGSQYLKFWLHPVLFGPEQINPPTTTLPFVKIPVPTSITPWHVAHDDGGSALGIYVNVLSFIILEVVSALTEQQVHPLICASTNWP